MKIGKSIALDFDGTVVTHEYPNIGKDIGAIPVLKELLEKGHRFNLFTMRSGKELKDAIGWFKDNDIPLSGIQYDSMQHTWTMSNKCYGNLYIDDCGIGTPLTLNVEISPKPFVDWKKIRILLVEKGYL